MKIILAVFVSLMFIFPASTDASVIHLHLKEGEFALSFLPLSNGEAALLHTAEGRQFLINTGYKGSGPEILHYMNKFQIRQLDGLIITEKKYWQERFIQQLIKTRKLKKIFAGWPAKDHLCGGRFIYEQWLAGTLQELDSGVKLAVLYNGSQKNEGLDFSIKHFDSRFLWMSSASRSAEKKMLTQSLKDSNIVKVPKFGVHGSLSYNLLTHIDPQTAIIFKRKDQRPNGELMEMLHQMWIDVYYAEQHGLIIVKFTKEGYEVFSIPELK
ncbi:hypothetical protein F9802_01975 [Bacillus aerolatus]|uniref:Hydrolase n=1 Tax=Bacillus aerolatus TaxID=2653354 RepID=A0A6I1FQD7_9BACI|nr:hypothetical protein [Bacillus aerolatus]KAB7708934.1 hypothetical protein F9802_01975 [Bacillus aerolatus]